MSEGAAQRNFRDVPTYDSHTCAEDLAWMLDRLRAVGIGEVMAVDLTRPRSASPSYAW